MIKVKRSAFGVDTAGESGLCAVMDCLEEGRRHVCPVDTKPHWHGKIHYEGGLPRHDLKFRSGGWYFMCDAHYKVIVEALGKDWDEYKPLRLRRSTK